MDENDINNIGEAIVTDEVAESVVETTPAPQDLAPESMRVGNVENESSGDDMGENKEISQEIIKKRLEKAKRAYEIEQVKKKIIKRYDRKSWMYNYLKEKGIDPDSIQKDFFSAKRGVLGITEEDNIQDKIAGLYHNKNKTLRNIFYDEEVDTKLKTLLYIMAVKAFKRMREGMSKGLYDKVMTGKMKRKLSFKVHTNKTEIDKIMYDSFYMLEKMLLLDEMGLAMNEEIAAVKRVIKESKVRTLKKGYNIDQIMSWLLNSGEIKKYREELNLSKADVDYSTMPIYKLKRGLEVKEIILGKEIQKAKESIKNSKNIDIKKIRSDIGPDNIDSTLENTLFDKKEDIMFRYSRSGGRLDGMIIKARQDNIKRVRRMWIQGKKNGIKRLEKVRKLLRRMIDLLSDMEKMKLNFIDESSDVDFELKAKRDDFYKKTVLRSVVFDKKLFESAARLGYDGMTINEVVNDGHIILKINIDMKLFINLLNRIGLYFDVDDYVVGLNKKATFEPVKLMAAKMLPVEVKKLLFGAIISECGAISRDGKYLRLKIGSPETSALDSMFFSLYRDIFMINPELVIRKKKKSGGRVYEIPLDSSEMNLVYMYVYNDNIKDAMIRSKVIKNIYNGVFGLAVREVFGATGKVLIYDLMKVFNNVYDKVNKKVLDIYKMMILKQSAVLGYRIGYVTSENKMLSMDELLDPGIDKKVVILPGNMVGDYTFETAYSGKGYFKYFISSSGTIKGGVLKSESMNRMFRFSLRTLLGEKMEEYSSILRSVDLDLKSSLIFSMNAEGKLPEGWDMITRITQQITTTLTSYIFSTIDEKLKNRKRIVFEDFLSMCSREIYRTAMEINVPKIIYMRGPGFDIVYKKTGKTLSRSLLDLIWMKHEDLMAKILLYRPNLDGRKVVYSEMLPEKSIEDEIGGQLAYVHLSGTDDVEGIEAGEEALRMSSDEHGTFVGVDDDDEGFTEDAREEAEEADIDVADMDEAEESIVEDKDDDVSISIDDDFVDNMADKIESEIRNKSPDCQFNRCFYDAEMMGLNANMDQETLFKLIAKRLKTPPLRDSRLDIKQEQNYYPGVFNEAAVTIFSYDPLWHAYEFLKRLYPNDIGGNREIKKRLIKYALSLWGWDKDDYNYIMCVTQFPRAFGKGDYQKREIHLNKLKDEGKLKEKIIPWARASGRTVEELYDFILSKNFSWR